MEIHPDAAVSRLEDLPNIGSSIANDLRSLGIAIPRDFARQAPLDIYQRLTPVMGKRHDPCVLCTFMAVEYFLKTAEPLPWWKFTEAGKRILRENP